MEAGQARLHREERLDQEEAPARTSHLVRQGAPGGDQDDPRRILRATLLRPKSWLPSRTRMPHGPADDLPILARDELVHRRRYLRLFGTIVTMPPCSWRGMRRGRGWSPALRFVVQAGVHGEHVPRATDRA